MKSLTTLIKLNNRQMDLIRKEAALLLESIESYEKDLKKLSAALIHEEELVQADPTYSFSFEPFKIKSLDKKRALKQAITEAYKKHDNLIEEVRDLFIETKKYEKLIELQKEKEIKKREKHEQLQLDEMGLNAYMRKE
jgi:hypothetical protein